MLIAVAVGTCGLMFQSLTFTDEILSGSILLGFILAMTVRKNLLLRINESKLDGFHRIIFIVFIAYVIIEGMRGLLILESLRKIRWIVYYGMIGVIAFVVSRNRCPFASRVKISLLIAIAALVYFSAYLFYGIFSEIFRGVHRYELQNLEWAGTTAAMFPLVAAMPAIFILLREKRRLYGWIAWITLTIAMVAAFYYESRVAWLVMLLFMTLSFRIVGLRKFVIFLFIFLVVMNMFIYFIWPEWYTLDLYLEGVFASLFNAHNATESHDLFRKVQLRVAFPAICTNVRTFLFGHGLRAAADVIGIHSARLYAKYAPFDLEGAYTARWYGSTEGFTAIVVETGVVGLLLLCMNFLCMLRKILFQKDRHLRTILILSLGVTFLWLFVANMFDAVLFFLMIMPSGLLLQLSGEKSAEPCCDGGV